MSTNTVSWAAMSVADIGTAISMDLRAAATRCRMHRISTGTLATEHTVCLIALDLAQDAGMSDMTGCVSELASFFSYFCK